MARFDMIVMGVYEYTLYEGQWYYYMNTRNSQRTPDYKKCVEGDIISVREVPEGRLYQISVPIEVKDLYERVHICLGEKIDKPVEALMRLVLE